MGHQTGVWEFVGASVRPDQARRLEQLAADSGRSKSAVIRRLIDLATVGERPDVHIAPHPPLADWRQDDPARAEIEERYGPQVGGYVEREGMTLEAAKAKAGTAEDNGEIF